MNYKLLSRKKAFIGVLIAISAYSATSEAKNYGWQLSAPGVRAEEKNTLGDIQFYFDKSVYHGAERPVLSWSVGGNPLSISIDKGVGKIDKVGTTTITNPVAGVNTYTLTETTGADSRSASASFEFASYEFGNIDFSFDKEFYAYGEIPVLSWNVGGYPMYIHIDHGIGEVPGSGYSSITNAAPGINIYGITVSTDTESKKADASYVMGKNSYISCNEIKQTIGRFASDGVYSIDPDGAGGSAPFNAYCNMTVDGGGWALAYKQYEHASGNITASYPGGAGTAPYLSPIGNLSTPNGSIASKLNAKEYMLYNTDNKYVVFGNPLGSLVNTSSCYAGQACIDVKSKATKSKGFATLNNVILAIMNSPSLSSVVFGTTNQPWCAIIDGRYNGSCVNGNIGKGNWILYVR